MLHKRMGCIFAILFLVPLFAVSTSGHAQAALLMEEPYGLFGTINPTGHNAIYFENICAETPTHLRRCQPGELGAVISRYEGVNGYDWIAIPLIPYLYSVEKAANVPNRVTHQQVEELRDKYREIHFTPLKLDQSGGNYVRDGWTQLIGVSYQRRVYAFRFKTTPKQDDALIARLNAEPNNSHFQMLYHNCADFARDVLNNYFPHTFRRSIFPDAGVTTPKQVTYKLVRYARKHPEMELTVYELPQIPGFRWQSRSNKDIAESFSTTAYLVPLTMVNPYLAGCIFIDYLARGRYHLIPKRPEVLGPQNLTALTAQPAANENSADAEDQVSGAAPPSPETGEVPTQVTNAPPQVPTQVSLTGSSGTESGGAESGLKESSAAQ